MVFLSVAGAAVFFFGLRGAIETHLERLPGIDLSSVFASYQQVLANPLFIRWTLCSALQIGIFFSMNAILGYQYQRNGYSLTQFGFWFALTPLSYLLGNWCNRKWFAVRGLERAAMIGTVLSLLAVVALSATQVIGMTHALSLALPCCLFGFGNGIVVANTIIGAISESGKHAGTGTGIVGAAQMGMSGLAGAVIVAFGGSQHFWVASVILIVMALVSVVSMLYVYAQRPMPVQS